MTGRLYTKEQLDFLRINYPLMDRKALTNAFNAHFQEDRSFNSISAALNNHKIISGRTGRFYKGHESWNKGIKGSIPVSKTSFKKGNIPANIRPLASERVDSKDGFILIKVKEYDKNTGFHTRFKHKHVHVWEQKNGRVPDGYVVAFKDGDRMNFNIDNLILISRLELLRLNKHGYKKIDNNIKPSVLALAKLEAKTISMVKE